MEAVTVQALTTIGGLALVTAMVVFIVRKAGNLSGQFMDRFGALMAVAIAVALALVAGVVLHFTAGTDLVQAALNGLVAGLAASGGYDVVNGTAKATSDS
jgi:hypothetical protein